ncbi:hypothetical protein GCM10009001_08770 [Virgibacillus siamensis]|uniref:Uncharacterized protein n=1 Tax=Virgibacillus siamensis TaxID=480071 RepID=A0ABP3QRZ9_9BACI
MIRFIATPAPSSIIGIIHHTIPNADAVDVSALAVDVLTFAIDVSARTVDVLTFAIDVSARTVDV